MFAKNLNHGKKALWASINHLQSRELNFIFTNYFKRNYKISPLNCSFAVKTNLLLPIFVFLLFLGGILLVAVNSLLYLNQSVPPYGVSLNSFTDFSTSFPLSKFYVIFFYLCKKLIFFVFFLHIQKYKIQTQHIFSVTSVKVL